MPRAVFTIAAVQVISSRSRTFHPAILFTPFDILTRRLRQIAPTDPRLFLRFSGNRRIGPAHIQYTARTHHRHHRTYHRYEAGKVLD